MRAVASLSKRVLISGSIGAASTTSLDDGSRSAAAPFTVSEHHLREIFLLLSSR